MDMSFFVDFVQNIASIDRLNVAIIALIFNALLGWVLGAIGGNANPLFWAVLNKFWGGFARKTYKTNRSVASLHFRGGIVLSLYIFSAAVLAALALILSWQFPVAGFTEPLLLTFVLCSGAVWGALLKLHKALKGKGKLAGGSYFDLAVSTRTNLNTTDDHGIIRTGIGYIATSFDKGIIAPLFWYLVAGLPAAFLYAGIMAARWAIAKEGFAKGIGHLSLGIEKFFGLVPQMISAIILALAAMLTPSAGVTRSLMGMYSGNGGRAPYAEGGLPLTVLAWGLGVSIGGPIEDSDGSVLKRTWVGSAKSTARAEIHHLRMAIYLDIMAYILTVALLLGGVTLKSL